MRINQIIVTGTFEIKRHKRKNPNCPPPTKEDIIINQKRLLHNFFTLRPASFRLHITYYIEELVAQNYLGKVLKARIEKDLQAEIGKLTINYNNIHHSFDLPVSPNEILTTLLPSIRELFSIEFIKVEEEAQSPPLPVLINNFLNTKLHTTFTIQIKDATLKIQYNKKKQLCRCSLILTGFSPEVQKFVSCIKKFEQKHND